MSEISAEKKLRQSSFYKWDETGWNEIMLPCKININEEYYINVDEFTLTNEKPQMFKMKYNVFSKADNKIIQPKTSGIAQEINEIVSLIIRSARLVHSA